ncbi:hypothetical protein T310_8356 [Rasamsonia emersonii CBS 393.64]|uniref:Rhodopsin domain-containing protein n=1 Tax=Rasamsonia emersonii (strain ATCC 16479 / CBS 393.64 / IMI 116815) TaxID=1408163 RepID=A0A0F4YHG3_RASE3|nr:hypothetical protein T310_8356 [Rasamsonia emersonii CBS 393.64]KKA17702.1 hypothetical protein T310_8356 [Rasamsonia emersonii CBS 393.64]
MSSATPPQAPVVAPKAVALIAVSTVLQALAFTTVLLRFLSRRANHSIGWDDWTALVALVLSTGLYISGICFCTVGYAGFHMDVLRPDQLERFLLIVYIDNIFYALTLSTIKFSILLMYRRIFRSKTFRHVTLAVGLLVLGWMIGVVFAQIFTCTPVKGAWDPAVAQHCIGTTKFYYGNAIANLLTDVVILCLPLPLVWRLNITTHRKLAISGIFLLGGLYDPPPFEWNFSFSLALTDSHSVCISSILRIVSLGSIDNNDITYTLVDVGVWTSTETPLAIICACLPTLPAYFKAWHRKIVTTNRSKDANEYLRSLRSNNLAWRCTSKSNYETLEGGVDTPLSDLPAERESVTEPDRVVDSSQIRLSHHLTADSSEP